MSRKKKIFLLIVIDVCLIIISSILAYLFVVPYTGVPGAVFYISCGMQVIAYLVYGFLFSIFNRINRYTSMKEIISIFLAITSTSLIILLASLTSSNVMSRRYIILNYFLSLFFIISSRVCWRIYLERTNKKMLKDKHLKRALVVGAGSSGEMLINSLSIPTQEHEIKVIGLVDDDQNKVHTVLNNVKVLGTTEDIPTLVAKHAIEIIILAIPSLKPKDYERILDIVNPLGIPINSVPSLEEIANGNVSVSRLREIDVVDLLGRAEVKLDMAQLSGQLNQSVILVTGAGGSIGSEICRQLLQFSPKRIILLGHGENSIYQIHRELKSCQKASTEFIPVIVDIKDQQAIFTLMEEHKPDVVYHAAAHKHVPMMEYNPFEAVRNNVFGTLNIAEAACRTNVASFVMVSTDKAVNPPNIMGATKRIAEMIVTGLNGVEGNQTKFSAVRFGNVLGSRGSVIPLFKEQIAQGGPVTVTDFRMTRFFMTIPEASRLVIQAGALANGGEIFILDMGEPVKIYDLAEKMIKLSGYSEEDISIIEMGVRPGEKLYEELLVKKEQSNKQVHTKIFVGNVKGFSLEETIKFLKKLPDNEAELKQAILSFANESSRCDNDV